MSAPAGGAGCGRSAAPPMGAPPGTKSVQPNRPEATLELGRLRGGVASCGPASVSPARLASAAGKQPLSLGQVLQPAGRVRSPLRSGALKPALWRIRRGAASAPPTHQTFQLRTLRRSTSRFLDPSRSGRRKRRGGGQLAGREAPPPPAHAQLLLRQPLHWPRGWSGPCWKSGGGTKAEEPQWGSRASGPIQPGKSCPEAVSPRASSSILHFVLLYCPQKML